MKSNFLSGRTLNMKQIINLVGIFICVTIYPIHTKPLEDSLTSEQNISSDTTFKINIFTDITLPSIIYDWGPTIQSFHRGGTLGLPRSYTPLWERDSELDFLITKSYVLPDYKAISLFLKDMWFVKLKTKKGLNLALAGGSSIRANTWKTNDKILDGFDMINADIETDLGIEINTFYEEMKDTFYLWNKKNSHSYEKKHEYFNFYLSKSLKDKTSFGMMLRPFYYSRGTRSYYSLLKRVAYDTTLNLYNDFKLMSLLTDFDDLKAGIDFDFSFSYSFSQFLSLYIRNSLSYNFLQNKVAGQTNNRSLFLDRKYDWGRNRGLFCKSHRIKAGHYLGLTKTSDANMPWKFMFLPFYGQFTTAELGFKYHYDDMYSKVTEKELSISYKTYQKIKFNNKFFSGFDNILYYNQSLFMSENETEFYNTLSYSPRIEIFNNFFVDFFNFVFNISLRKNNYGNYTRELLYTHLYLLVGYRYFKQNWGLSVSVGMTDDNYLDNLNFLIWRKW